MIGHDIEDEYETRNEFVNEERLLKLKEKIESHPILGSTNNIDKMVISRSCELSRSSNAAIQFISHSKPGILCFDLYATEPHDTLQIRINAPGEKKGTIWVKKTLLSYERTINLTAIYKKGYEDAARRNNGAIKT